MRITRIEIRNFTPFVIAGTQSLVLDTEKSIQVILGTNGTGKSALIREITPMPAGREDYEEDGYKRIDITYRGAHYVLTSDFSKPNRAHSFIRNDVELNDSGTTGGQKDLVQQHLNYTPTVDALINLRFLLTRETASGRRQFLTAASPYNIGFILDKHKAACSRIRTCKEMLQRQYARRDQLKAQILDAALVAELQKESVSLNDVVARHIEFLHETNSLIAEYTEEKSTLSTSPRRAGTDALLRDGYDNVRRFAGVPRGDIDLRISELDVRLAEIRTSMTGLEARTSEYAGEISRYQNRLLELQCDQTEEVYHEICGLEETVDRLEPLLIEDPFPAILMDDIPPILEDIRKILVRFEGCTVKLLRVQHIQRKQNKLWYRQRQIGTLTTLLREKEENLIQVKAALKYHIRDIPKDKCAGDACPLFRSFRTTFDRNEAMRADLEIQIANLRYRINRWSTYVEHLREQTDALSGYAPHLTALNACLAQYRHLAEVLRKQNIDVLFILKSNPMVIYQRLSAHYANSRDYHQYHTAKRTLAEKILEREKLSNTDSGEKRLLGEVLAEKTETYSKVRTEFQQVEAEYSTVLHQQDLAVSYRSYLHTLEEIREGMLGDLHAQTLAFEIGQLQTLRGHLEGSKRKAIERLGTINQTLRDQDILKALYEGEVETQIRMIETERDELVALEKALSPSSGIPHVFSVEFLNDLIETTNYYIAQVFSYPLALVPLDAKRPVDYKFPLRDRERVKTDATTTMTSKAQRETIDLCFDLALMHVVGVTDIPLKLDEYGDSLDTYHVQQLLHLLTRTVDEETVSQLFLVNHHAAIHDGLANASVLVMNGDNILKPPKFNEHAQITPV